MRGKLGVVTLKSGLKGYFQLVYANIACVFSSQITFEPNGHFQASTKKMKHSQSLTVLPSFIRIGSQVDESPKQKEVSRPPASIRHERS